MLYCPRRSDSKVPSRIHTLVQDADHIHTIIAVDVKNQMTADAEATVSLTNLITFPPTLGVGRDPFDTGPDFGNVRLCLMLIPAFMCEIPDR